MHNSGLSWALQTLFLFVDPVILQWQPPIHPLRRKKRTYTQEMKHFPFHVLPYLEDYNQLRKNYLTSLACSINTFRIFVVTNPPDPSFIHKGLPLLLTSCQLVTGGHCVASLRVSLHWSDCRRAHQCTAVHQRRPSHTTTIIIIILRTSHSAVIAASALLHK